MSLQDTSRPNHRGIFVFPCLISDERIEQKETKIFLNHGNKADCCSVLDSQSSFRLLVRLVVAAAAGSELSVLTGYVDTFERPITARKPTRPTYQEKQRTMRDAGRTQIN